jgi:hypothetical protein
MRAAAELQCAAAAVISGLMGAARCPVALGQFDGPKSGRVQEVLQNTSSDGSGKSSIGMYKVRSSKSLDKASTTGPGVANKVFG